MFERQRVDEELPQTILQALTTAFARRPSGGKELFSGEDPTDTGRLCLRPGNGRSSEISGALDPASAPGPLPHGLWMSVVVEEVVFGLALQSPRCRLDVNFPFPFRPANRHR